jgi:hypothetical protein
MKKQFEDLKKYLTDPDMMGVYWLMAIVTCGISLIVWDGNRQTPEMKEQQSLALKCMSKSSGSKPQCWSEADWAAFCENTNICKNATVK